MKTLGNYAIWLNPILETICTQVEFSCQPTMTEILKERRLIVILNHATPLSWIPAVCLLTKMVTQFGGGDRTPRGVVDRWFYQNPFTQKIAEYFSQSAHPLTFSELVETFSKSKKTDLVIFPEGANTFFGNVHELQTFRSSRFVELAILTQTPILIVAHSGSESWSLPLSIPKQFTNLILPFAQFFGPKLLNEPHVNFPFPIEKIKKFKMQCQLYRPTVTLADLPADSETHKEIFQRETAQIRELMQSMLQSLQAKHEPL